MIRHSHSLLPKDVRVSRRFVRVASKSCEKVTVVDGEYERSFEVKDPSNLPQELIDEIRQRFPDIANEMVEKVKEAIEVCREGEAHKKFLESRKRREAS